MIKVIPIEGGLGAQIFGAMLFDHLKELYSSESVFADLTYFDRTPFVAGDKQGVSVFKWELDYYGIDKEEFRKEIPKKPNFFQRHLLNKPNHSYLYDGTSERTQLLGEVWNKNWDSRFPILSSDVDKATEILGKDLNTAVVHLRRGDYLNVASHIVPDDCVINLLKKISYFDIGKVIFLSDSPVDISYYAGHLKAIKKFEAFVSEDIFLTHALLRLGRIVVTSNSQFSLSAAILNRGGLIFMPRKWYSGSAELIETQIHQLSDWHLMGVNLDVK